MEKKETRGRPATGRKQYKHIGIRLDEATFNLYENLALENGAESLPAFIKDNLDKIFKKDDNTVKLPENLLFFLEKIEDDRFKKSLLKRLNIKTYFFVEKFIFTSMLVLTFDKGIFEEETAELYHNIYFNALTTDDGNTKRRLFDLVENEIIRLLEKQQKNTENKLLYEYFIEYRKIKKEKIK